MTRRRSRRVMAEMNVVPYIDVMLVLLVIFMVTAPMMQTGVNVEAPSAQAEPLEGNNQQQALIITVDASGQFYLDDGTHTDSTTLSQYVSQQLREQQQRPVYIRADHTVEYRHLMNAMVAVQQAGAKQIGLMTEPTPLDN